MARRWPIGMALCWGSKKGWGVAFSEDDYLFFFKKKKNALRCARAHKQTRVQARSLRLLTAAHCCAVLFVHAPQCPRLEAR
jgi:hypothetical protein